MTSPWPHRDPLADRERDYHLLHAIFTRTPPRLHSIPDAHAGFVSFTGLHVGTLSGTYPHDPTRTPCTQDHYLLHSLLDIPAIPGPAHHAALLIRVHNPLQPDRPRWWGWTTYRQSLSTHPTDWGVLTDAGASVLTTIRDAQTGTHAGHSLHRHWMS